MHCSLFFTLAAFAVQASAHGLVTQIQGANGVTMPGLSGTVLSIHLSIDSS